MQDAQALPTLTPDDTRSERVAFTISLETVAYIALLVLALVLRLAELDTVPLSEAEARQALAAWNVVEPDAPGDVPVAVSPWLLLTQTSTFAVLGASEFTARVLTALAGLALVFAPLLFRDLLGRSRTFLLAVVLAFSPVLLLASRGASPVVWSVLIAVGGIWCALRYARTASTPYAAVATILFTATVFLVDPAGYLLAVVLAVAYLGARALAPDDADDAKPERASRFRDWPWLPSLGLALFVVVLVGTHFMLHRASFSSIGALLGAGFAGLTTPLPGAPPVYPLLVSVIYEPFFWLFAVVGVRFAWRRGMTGMIDRFFAIWLIAGAAALLLYVGATPAHALWLSVPLAGLTSRAAAGALRDDPRNIWDSPSWAPWLLAALTVGLIFTFTIALQMVARSLSRLTSLAELTAQPLDAIGLILIVMVAMFFFVG